MRILCLARHPPPADISFAPHPRPVHRVPMPPSPPLSKASPPAPGLSKGSPSGLKQPTGGASPKGSPSGLNLPTGGASPKGSPSGLNLPTGGASPKGSPSGLNLPTGRPSSIVPTSTDGNAPPSTASKPEGETAEPVAKAKVPLKERKPVPVGVMARAGDAMGNAPVWVWIGVALAAAVAGALYYFNHSLQQSVADLALRVRTARIELPDDLGVLEAEELYGKKVYELAHIQLARLGAPAAADDVTVLLAPATADDMAAAGVDADPRGHVAYITTIRYVHRALGLSATRLVEVTRVFDADGYGDTQANRREYAADRERQRDTDTQEREMLERDRAESARAAREELMAKINEVPPGERFNRLPSLIELDRALAKERLTPPPPADYAIIYGANWCAFSKAMADALSAAGVRYIERDVESDESAARELIAKARAQGFSVSAVPITDFGGQLVAGFDIDAVDRWAARQRR